MRAGRGERVLAGGSSDRIGAKPAPSASVLCSVTVAVAVAVMVPMMMPIVPLSTPVVVVWVMAPIHLLDCRIGRRRGRFDRRAVRGKKGGGSRLCLNCESKQAADSHSSKETHSGFPSKWKPERRPPIWPQKPSISGENVTDLFIVFTKSGALGGECATFICVRCIDREG